MAKARREKPNLLNNIRYAVAAYGLRKLLSTYTGYAVKIRHSVSNTEFNIGFNAAGELDTDTITTVLGSNSGFVTTWYDQTGNGHDMVQTTNANQPRIVNAGTLENVLSVPTIRFLGGAGGLATENFTGAFDLGFTVVVTAKPVGDVTTIGLVSKTGNASPSPFDLTTNNATGNTSLVVGNNSAQSLGVYNQFSKIVPLSVYTYSSDTQNSTYWVNNVFDSTRTLTAYGDSQGKSMRIGSRNDLSTSLDGYVSEVVVYGRALDAQSRSFVERNHLKRFKIKPVSNLSIIGDDWAIGLGSSVIGYFSWPNQLKSLISNFALFAVNDSPVGLRYKHNTNASLSAVDRVQLPVMGFTNRLDNQGGNIVIQAGSNDIASGDSVATAYGNLKLLLIAIKTGQVVYNKVLIATIVPQTSDTLTGSLFALNDCIRYGLGGTVAQTGNLTTTAIQAIATQGELLNSTHGATGMIDFAALSAFNTVNSWSNTTYYAANGKNVLDAGYALMAAAAKTALSLT